MPNDPGTMVQAAVLIPFDDQAGHHAEGETIMLPAGNNDELDNLRRLVEYSIVNAAVPGEPTMGVNIPEPADYDSETHTPPPPPIPPDGVVIDPLTHLPRVQGKG